MTTTDFILLAMLPVSLAACALCAASETTLFSLTHADRLRLRKTAPRTAAIVATLLEKPRELLVTLLLANVTAATLVYVISSVLGRHVFEGAGGAAIGIASTLAVILFGDILPKTLAAGHRVRFASLLAPPMMVFFRLIAPIRIVGDRLVIAPLARLVRPNASEQVSAVSIEELNALVDLGARQGAIDRDEQRLLADVVQLGSMRVRDVMIPRIDLEVIDENATLEALLKVIGETGFTRFPVVRASLDDGVIGFIGVKQVLAAHAKGGSFRVGQICVPVQFVPERARLDQLLAEFRRTRTHLAMCVSEAGAITGMVEVEDVVKELVAVPGASDESPEHQVRMVGLGKWEVPGRLSIRDWSSCFGSRKADDLSFDSRISTVGGLILARLGRVPVIGDEIRVANLRLRVAAMEGRTVERVAVSMIASEAAGSAQSDPLEQREGAS